MGSFMNPATGQLTPWFSDAPSASCEPEIPQNREENTITDNHLPGVWVLVGT